MDRTVPKTGSEEIQLYMRTYYSLLRSSHTIQIETLVESHLAMGSLLHPLARSTEPDTSALTYSSLRLPDCMIDTEQVLIGQIERSFVEAGFIDIQEWERVSAPGRRRRMHFDGKSLLAVFIASRSDIDDLVPTLTAFQIEWNKLHTLLQVEDAKAILEAKRSEKLSEAEFKLIAETVYLNEEELRRLEVVWGERFTETLYQISQRRKTIGLRMLAGSLADYRRATAYWWSEVDAQMDEVDLENRPVYFVSSNTHCLANLLTGFAQREEHNLAQYIEQMSTGSLVKEYQTIRDSDSRKGLDNLLYYVLKKYLSDHGQKARDSQLADERTIGIYRIPSRHGFDVEAQVIDLKRLRLDWMDKRLADSFDESRFASSDALILNIDYPLGLAAYELLNRVTERVGSLRGVYIMGKSATLNGRVGDVMIPSVIHDEHSQNTYMFQNCFSALDIAPYLTYGMVLDNQKGISVPGTFLQNPSYMGVFYQEGYTDIEMEAGPFLSSIYEAFRPKLHPYNEIVNLYGVPFDVGFLHYASDTPMSKGKNLGSSNLSYAGVDPTYATAIAILRRIFVQEIQRLRQKSVQRSTVTAEV
ncbi:MAG: hypothetical protein LCI00_04935 [Chloroflexi bacterium]|nr:hypothetical protein [Chloroflexota bacterium]MCC6896398.1 hypothetical protein [Anaerolineae bacterium]